jgi:trans-2,3-dihydro-3-hydroxyanthranilate isomerase
MYHGASRDSGRIVTDYPFRILNVFAIAGERFSGNPLCVFEDARGMDDATMQAVALQFNLSETTFILPSSAATARVRIFTPGFEMPFAGHPTLGTAHVVRETMNSGDRLSLEMKAGVIPVSAEGNTWTLQANAPTHRAAEASREQFAEMLGVAAEDILDGAMWVNTGSEQLVIPMRTAAAVRNAAPTPDLLARYARQSESRQLAYVWAPEDDARVTARFFFRKGTTIVEDPATGSACANLGGWLAVRSSARPIRRTVFQGDMVKRPSRLGLNVDEAGAIFVSGLVVPVARGNFTV